MSAPFVHRSSAPEPASRALSAEQISAASLARMEARLSELEVDVIATSRKVIRQEDELFLLRTAMQTQEDELVELQDKVAKLQAAAGMADDEAEEGSSDEEDGFNSEPEHPESDEDEIGGALREIKSAFKQASRPAAATDEEDEEEEQNSVPSTPVKAAGRPAPVCPGAPIKSNKRARTN